MDKYFCLEFEFICARIQSVNAEVLYNTLYTRARGTPRPIENWIFVAISLGRAHQHIGEGEGPKTLIFVIGYAMQNEKRQRNNDGKKSNFQ